MGTANIFNFHHLFVWFPAVLPPASSKPTIFTWRCISLSLTPAGWLSLEDLHPFDIVGGVTFTYWLMGIERSFQSHAPWVVKESSWSYHWHFQQFLQMSTAMESWVQQVTPIAILSRQLYTNKTCRSALFLPGIIQFFQGTLCPLNCEWRLRPWIFARHFCVMFSGFTLKVSNWPACEHAHRLIDACVLANRCDIEACQMY